MMKQIKTSFDLIQSHKCIRFLYTMYTQMYVLLAQNANKFYWIRKSQKHILQNTKQTDLIKQQDWEEKKKEKSVESASIDLIIFHSLKFHWIKVSK